ncbi:RAxF-45 family protein [Amphibacillus sp. Q70]
MRSKALFCVSRVNGISLSFFNNLHVI